MTRMNHTRPAIITSVNALVCFFKVDSHKTCENMHSGTRYTHKLWVGISKFQNQEPGMYVEMYSMCAWYTLIIKKN